VLDQKVDHDQMELSVRLSPDNWARFQAMESA
jgi:GTP-binding protein HflX